MQILPITSIQTNYQKYNKINKSTPQTHCTNIGYANIYPTFGYCEPHMRMMRTLNGSLYQSVCKNFAEYSEALQASKNYMAKLELIEKSQRKAAQLLTQYASYEYSLAEVIPSYALECASELKSAIESTQIFSNPKDVLVTIGNIPKLATRAGIDKHTGKEYTVVQTLKSRANSQLYSTAIMLDILDKSIKTSSLPEEEQTLVLEMRDTVLRSISSIYGEDAYARIQKLKMMGSDASIEDKRASLNILQEFDSKAKELDFGREFYENLDKLIKHKETFGTDIDEAFTGTETRIPPVVLAYHTHPQEAMHTHEHTHTHEHEDEHSHEYMHTHGIPHTHNDEVLLEKKLQ